MLGVLELHKEYVARSRGLIDFSWEVVVDSAKRVLGTLGLTVVGVVLGLLLVDKIPTRHFDWTDYLTWAVCSVLIYSGFAWRAWTAGCSARKKLRKGRKC
jgi:uncharacterized membrane protein YfcA